MNCGSISSVPTCLSMIQLEYAQGFPKCVFLPKVYSEFGFITRHIFTNVHSVLWGSLWHEPLELYCPKFLQPSLIQPTALHPSRSQLAPSHLLTLHTVGSLLGPILHPLRTHNNPLGAYSNENSPWEKALPITNGTSSHIPGGPLY